MIDKNKTEEAKKKKCADHKVQFQGGDTNQSEFGCDNCSDDHTIEPEDCGTGA